MLGPSPHTMGSAPSAAALPPPRASRAGRRGARVNELSAFITPFVSAISLRKSSRKCEIFRRRDDSESSEHIVAFKLRMHTSYCDSATA